MSGTRGVRELAKRVRAAAVAIALLSARATAQEAAVPVEDAPAFSFGVENAINSAYVWRGIVIDDQPVMQPAAWFTWSGLTVVGWHSRSLTARFHTSSLTVGYESHWSGVRIEPRLEAFWWSEEGGASGTVEGSVDVSYQHGPLTVFTTHTFDASAFRGSYFGEAGVGAEFAVNEVSALEVYVWSGWASSKFNETYIGPGKAAFNFIEAESWLTYYLEPFLYFRPHLHFSYVTDARLREELWWPSFVDFGVALGVEF